MSDFEKAKLVELIDKVGDITSDFTMPYDDDSMPEYSPDSIAYQYACILDSLNAILSQCKKE